MSETRTVYIVRGWAMGEREFTSRKQADAFATEVEGTVVRRTITEEEVGLRWEHARDRFFRLHDGGRVVAVVCGHGDGWCMDHDGPAYSLNEHDNGSEWVECSTLDEAKAAAEAAVRETWT